jgi:hypothetical protein
MNGLGGLLDVVPDAVGAAPCSTGLGLGQGAPRWGALCGGEDWGSEHIGYCGRCGCFRRWAGRGRRGTADNACHVMLHRRRSAPTPDVPRAAVVAATTHTVYVPTHCERALE